MAISKQNTHHELSEIQYLLIELEKNEPDRKIIKSLTTKYSIPYKANISEQLDELLHFLNSVSFEPEKETLLRMKSNTSLDTELK